MQNQRLKDKNILLGNQRNQFLRIEFRWSVTDMVKAHKQPKELSFNVKRAFSKSPRKVNIIARGKTLV